MNKLLVSGIINLDSGSYELDFNNNEALINIHGDVNIYIINKQLKKLIINLADNSKLNIYKYDDSLKNNVDIIINENNNSTVNLNNNFINKSDTLITINNYITGDNNNSNINIRNISNKGNSKIIVNVYIKENTINNTALEDLKGLVNGGFIHIEPNIICNSNEVVANHLTTIGTFNENVLDYLMSKGLSRNSSKGLLLNGFICNNMDNYMKENIRR